MSNRPATMSDVAERAQVSKVAVSVVLHGTRTNTRVAETTRQRILQAAQDLQYTPNHLARALLRRRMNIIGLYLGDKYLDTRSLFMSEVVAGMQIGCHIHRKDLLIHGTFRGQSVADIHAEMLGGKIDGLVMFAKPDDPLAMRLAASSLPAVAIVDAVPNLPSVVADDRGGSEALAAHLAGRGHRQVLYRRGPVTQTSTVRRCLAFREAAAMHGMAVVEDASIIFTDGPLSRWEQDLLAGPADQRPTAVVCATDRIAYATVDYCQSLGLQVPGDISVTGFDGMVPEMQPAVQLTTIKAPWAEVARVAVDLLMERLAGREILPETVLPVELVLGRTA